MSDLKELQKKAAKKADEHTGELNPNCAKTNEWFGFYYGYIAGIQEMQANEVVDTTNKALHKQNVTNRTFWQTLKSTFIPPKNWNIIQWALAYLYFVGAAVIGIKLILLLFGYGW